jgi:hypothetical protein
MCGSAILGKPRTYWTLVAFLFFSVTNGDSNNRDIEEHDRLAMENPLV